MESRMRFQTRIFMKSTIFWNVMPCRNLPMFWRNILPPPSGLKLTACYLLACLAYSLTVKLDMVHLSETSVNFYQTTRLNIPEDGTFLVTAVRTSNLTMLLCWTLENTYISSVEYSGSIIILLITHWQILFLADLVLFIKKTLWVFPIPPIFSLSEIKHTDIRYMV
jgi:hypothetical protein